MKEECQTGSSETSDVVRYSRYNPFDIARDIPSMILTLGKNSVDFSRRNLGLNQENFAKFMKEVKVGGAKLAELIPVDLRLHINIKAVELVIKQGVKHALLYNNGKFKMFDAVSIVDPVWKDNRIGCQLWNIDDKLSEDLVSMVLWFILNDNGKCERTKVEDTRIKSWNRRVDEQKLLRKIGSPRNWDMQPTHTDRNENGCDTLIDDADGIPKTVDIDYEVVNEELPDETNSSNNGLINFPYIDLENKHSFTNESKKKYGLFRPITKFFRSGKYSKGREHNELSRPAVNGNAQTIRNSLDKTQFIDRHIPGGVSPHISSPVANITRYNSSASEQKRKASKNGHNDDMEGLKIQIPSNINKIVLIKDGRRIAIEI